MIEISGKKSKIRLNEGGQYFFSSGKPVKFIKKERGRFIISVDGETQRWTENTIWNTPMFYKSENKLKSTKCIH